MRVAAIAVMLLSQRAGDTTARFQPIPASDVAAAVFELGGDLCDAILGVRWVAVFKGGVYGVQNDRSFLLLPRPEYGGAERLGFDGDWLVISAWRAIDGTDRTSQVRPVARYNRRTRELRVINEGVR